MIKLLLPLKVGGADSQRSPAARYGQQGFCCI